MKKHLIQARIDDKDKQKFEEIRSIIAFEKMKGVHITPVHPHSKDDRIRDSDVIRYIVRNFKFMD